MGEWLRIESRKRLLFERRILGVEVVRQDAMRKVALWIRTVVLGKFHCDGKSWWSTEVKLVGQSFLVAFSPKKLSPLTRKSRVTSCILRLVDYIKNQSGWAHVSEGTLEPWKSAYRIDGIQSTACCQLTTVVGVTPHSACPRFFCD